MSNAGQIDEARAHQRALAVARTRSRTRCGRPRSFRNPEDFLFIPDCVAENQRLANGPLDPVLALDEFQRWAFEEVRTRRHTRPNPRMRIGPFFSLQRDEQLPEGEQPRIVVGRLLALLLAGANDLGMLASDAIAGGAAWGLKALLRAGMKPDLTFMDIDERKKTLLHFAVEKGRVQCARVLVKAGANPTRKDRRGTSPLDLARATKKPALVRALSLPPAKGRPGAHPPTDG